MFKRIVMTAVLGLTASLAASERSDAGIWYRPAPVRRVAARAVLPPYPVARRVVARPVYGPAYGAYAPYGPVVAPVYGYGGPVAYGAPYVYGGGITVGFGF